MEAGKMHRVMAIVSLFLVLCGASQGIAQDREEGLYDPEKLRIHLSPLNFLDPSTGVLQVGVQKNFSPRLSLLLDHGFKLQTFRHMMWGKETQKKDWSYSKTKLELKYFLKVKNRDQWSRVFPYLSVEAFYFPQEYRRENFVLYRDGQSLRYVSADIQKNVWVGSLKYGKEIRYDRVVIDKYIGLGVRKITITHAPFGLGEEVFFDEGEWGFGPSDQEAGTEYRIHLSLGIKFGYIFR